MVFMLDAKLNIYFRIFIKNIILYEIYYIKICNSKKRAEK